MTLDVNSAVKIYTDYCTSNGFTAAAAPTTTSSPVSTTSGTQYYYSPATVTVTVVQTFSVAGAAPRLQPTLLRLAAQVAHHMFDID